MDLSTAAVVGFNIWMFFITLQKSFQTLPTQNLRKLNTPSVSAHNGHCLSTYTKHVYENPRGGENIAKKWVNSLQISKNSQANSILGSSPFASISLPAGMNDSITMQILISVGRMHVLNYLKIHQFFLRVFALPLFNYILIISVLQRYSAYIKMLLHFTVLPLAGSKGLKEIFSMELS